MDRALQAQRGRGVLSRERFRNYGNRLYDADFALLKLWNPFFPRFNGHMVGQQSLEYALSLLFSDDRTYGGDDAEEANRILRRILEHQDLRPGSETFGNFFWMTHWNSVKDLNAVSFLVSGLVYSYLRFGEKLEPSTKSALVEAFPRVLAGIRGHRVRWQYTNIFFLNLGGLVSLSRVLGDDSPLREAEDMFNVWLEGTSKDGLQEFNSPCYTPVTLFGLESAWANAPEGFFRRRMERVLDFLTRQLALNIMPSGFLAGAASRAYSSDALYGDGNAAVYSHIKLGTACPRTEKPSCVNATLFDYVPPEQIRRLALEKPDCTEIRDRSVDRSSGIESLRTHVMTPGYSIASQCLVGVGGHSPPAYILVARKTDSARKSVPVLPDESFTHQPCAEFESRQEGTTVLGRLRYRLKEEDRGRFLEDRGYVCEPRVLFGLKNDIREVRIDNIDWGGNPVRLRSGQSVCAAYDGLFLGLKAETGCPGKRFLLSFGEDGELRLRLTVYGGPDLEPGDEPAQILLFMEAKEPRGTLADYADFFTEWSLSAAGPSSFEAGHAGGGRVSYPTPPGAQGLPGDALHVSPGLIIRPGSLLEAVNG